jgi:hypothetical protein
VSAVSQLPLEGARLRLERVCSLSIVVVDRFTQWPQLLSQLTAQAQLPHPSAHERQCGA